MEGIQRQLSNIHHIHHPMSLHCCTYKTYISLYESEWFFYKQAKTKPTSEMTCHIVQASSLITDTYVLVRLMTVFFFTKFQQRDCIYIYVLTRTQYYAKSFYHKCRVIRVYKF